MQPLRKASDISFDLHNLTNQGGRTRSSAAGEGARSWGSGGGVGSDVKEQAEPGSGSARLGSGPISPRLDGPAAAYGSRSGRAAGSCRDGDNEGQ